MTDEQTKHGGVCAHGQNKRQCEICGLESQVEQWKDEVKGLEKDIGSMKTVINDYTALTRRAHAIFEALIACPKDDAELWVALGKDVKAWMEDA